MTGTHLNYLKKLIYFKNINFDKNPKIFFWGKRFYMMWNELESQNLSFLMVRFKYTTIVSVNKDHPEENKRGIYTQLAFWMCVKTCASRVAFVHKVAIFHSGLLTQLTQFSNGKFEINEYKSCVWHAKYSQIFISNLNKNGMWKITCLTSDTYVYLQCSNSIVIYNHHNLHNRKAIF